MGRVKSDYSQSARIHDWLNEVGNQTLNELQNHFYDLKDYNLGKRSTLRGRLSEMVKDGSLLKLPSGRYKVVIVA